MGQIAVDSFHYIGDDSPAQFLPLPVDVGVAAAREIDALEGAAPVFRFTQYVRHLYFPQQGV